MGSLAPTAAHAVKAQGVQTGTRRAGARTRQGHWVRGSRGQQRTFDDDDGLYSSRGPKEETNLQPPSKLGGLPPGKSQKYGQDHSQRLTYGKFNIMLRARG